MYWPCPGVKSGTLSFFLPVTSSSRNDNTYSKEAVMDSKNGIGMQTWTVDYDYIKTMGMEIIKGRNFSKEFADSNATIINETTAKLLGMMIRSGKRYIRLQITMDRKFLIEIIGVVKNFHFESLRQKMLDHFVCDLATDRGLASFKIDAANIKRPDNSN